MLPDYPKIKNKLLKMMNEFLIKYIRKDPLFSQIREEVHFEGNKMSIKTQNGMIDVSLYKKIEESFEIRPEEIITKGCLFLVENAIKIGREFKRKRAQLLFSKIDEITKKTGAQIKGQPFTFDTFLKALEKIEIEFDEKGNPCLPTLIVNPVLAAELKKKLPEWVSNPEYKKKYEALIERKRKEWYVKESNRKLVD